MTSRDVTVLSVCIKNDEQDGCFHDQEMVTDRTDVAMDMTVM